MRRLALIISAVLLLTATRVLANPLLPLATVTGRSMAPVLRQGDLLIYEKTISSDIRVGDIIVFDLPSNIESANRHKGPVAHRVVEKRDGTLGTSYRTKGDNNLSQDPWEVRQETVIGKVGRKVSYLGIPALFLDTSGGFVFLTLIFLVSILCIYAEELGRIKWNIFANTMIVSIRRNRLKSHHS